jgi:hypothetical protein
MRVEPTLWRFFLLFLFRPDLNKWLAGHVVDFFNDACLMYGCLDGCCTAEACPRMMAGRWLFFAYHLFQIPSPKALICVAGFVAGAVSAMSTSGRTASDTTDRYKAWTDCVLYASYFYDENTNF